MGHELRHNVPKEQVATYLTDVKGTLLQMYKEAADNRAELMFDVLGPEMVSNYGVEIGRVAAEGRRLWGEGATRVLVGEDAGGKGAESGGEHVFPNMETRIVGC